MQENILISVIVPIYNTEKYIERCIKSIQAQSINNIEIILIDDGSKDRSYEICKEISYEDNRIKVYQKENGGVSSARNLGISKAKGEWICFVDSDDYVLPDYLLNMIKKLPSNDENEYLIASSYCNINGNVIIEEGISVRPNIPSDSIKKNMMFTPWGKLFNHSIISKNNIQFPVGITNGEDFVFICKYIKFIKYLILVNSHDYIYSTQPNSASVCKRTFEEELINYSAMRTAWEEMMETFNYKNKINLLWESGVYIRFGYLLCSLYNLPQLSYSKQLKKLLQIKDDILEFSHYAPVKGIRTTIARYLLKKKYFSLYIIFNRVLLIIGKNATA